MTIRTSLQALAVAKGQTRNTPGTCQLNVRTWFNAPSAGDQDHDGDADAIDGWLSEPVARRHPGDRNPPPGKPLAFKNADGTGFGHRALSGVREVISTDMYGNRYRSGYTSAVTGTSIADAIRKVELAMGLIYLGWSDTIDGYVIPKDPDATPVVKPKKLRRQFAHVSLQAGDSDRMHAADIEKVFRQGYAVITGTEAGPGAGNTNEVLHKMARKYGYALSIFDNYDTWAALKRSNLVPGSVKRGKIFGIQQSSKFTPKPPGRWGPKAVVWVQGVDKQLGLITVGSVHTPTAKAAGRDLIMKLNAEYASKMGTFGRRFGKDHGLAFIGGDFNMVDKLRDVFFKEPFTTCWDELKVWPNTGHGNIDAIASWDADHRVRCVSGRAHDDSNFFLHTDHFLITTTYEIEVAPVS